MTTTKDGLTREELDRLVGLLQYAETQPESTQLQAAAAILSLFDQLAASQAETARLREALEPLAKANVVSIHSYNSDTYAIQVRAEPSEQPKLAWFNDARAALQEHKP